jgi:hypothetical protein
MSGIFLGALLVIGMGQMQATTQTVSAAAPEANPVAASKGTVAAQKKELSPSSPVITIHGLCQGAKSAKAATGACTTTVSKQEFDSVVNALNAIGPQLLAPQKRIVAEGYANMLVTYDAAMQAGIEHDPRFAEVMRLARMRAIGDMYKAFLLEKASKVSEKEIEGYYNSNLPAFEELTMRRVTLPRYNEKNLKDDAFAARARKVAEDVEARAARGEDIDKLQNEAFATLGVKNPPKTVMGPVRRGLYAPEQEKEIFALKPGEVTRIIEQPSAFIIFKLESREMLKLDSVKDEIKQTLTRQHMEKAEQAKKEVIKVDYDENYVGPAPKSAWMPASELKGDKQQGKPEATAQSQKK